MVIPTTLGLLVTSLLVYVAAGECPGERPTKHLLCYLEEIPAQFDPCLCTHLVLQTPLEKLSPQSELVKTARRLQEKNPSLKLILQASESAEVALKKRGGYARAVTGAVNKCGLDGVEVALRWGKQTAGKVQLVDFVQTLSTEFAKNEPKERTKRSYKIHENIDDDVVTPRWTLQANSKMARKTRAAETAEDSKEKETTESTQETSPSQEIIEEEEVPDNGKQIILHLTAEPQYLAKNFDLKRLSKYVSFYTLASDNLTDSSERGLAYHPSRLMGIEDILNADSLVDLVTGLGAPHDKLVLTLPATALRFTLADKEKNLPQSPVSGQPAKISRAELCTLMSEGEWTVERDEDLTAPYAFHDTTWLAFDDPTSVSIKGKYVLLRDLAGAAVRSADAEDWMGKCNSSGAVLLQTLHDTFTHIARRSRAAQLVSLQEQLHEAGQFSYSGDVHLSPYRIVRVVDRAGSIHVVRKEAKTEFECSRQGYFRHPSGCNRFYRCVKFNQYTPDFTVFEYDCPAGLAFDETVEVCVWPGSLADGGACQGSSEIAPVPRTRYVCPQAAGYYADPENCRWFFACLDHQGDGSPLTAYEFRCPFGLVFDEQALVCNWPWLVPGCGGAGVYRARFTVGDFYEGRHRPSYASLSDVHVSGGRIENVPGGVVLDSAVRGIGSGAYFGSGGSYDGGNLLGSGAYTGAGGAYGGLAGVGVVGNGAYLAGGAGLADLGAGDLASGTYQSNTVVGSGSGAGYSAGSGAFGAGNAGTVYTSGLNAGAGNAGTAYTTGLNAGAGNAGTVYTSGLNAGAGNAGTVYTSGLNAGAGNAGTVYTSGLNAGAGNAGTVYTSGLNAGAGNAGTVYTSGLNAGAGNAGTVYTSGLNAGAGNAGTVYTSGLNAGAGNAGTVYTSGLNAGAGNAGTVYTSGLNAGAGNAGTVYTSGLNAGAGNAGTVYTSGLNAGAGNAETVYTSGLNAGAGNAGTVYTSGLNAGAGNAGTVYTSEGNAGAYIAGAAGNAGVYNAGTGKYSATYSGAGGYRGGAYNAGASGSSSTRYGGTGFYGSYGNGAYVRGGDYSGGYYEDNSGAYIHDHSGDYVHDNSGDYRGDSSGLYTGKESYGGQYTGNYVGGGAYVHGLYDNGAYSGESSSGGKYKGSYVGGGAYSGSYDTGAYRGSGSDGGKYKGEYDAGSYSGKYDTGSYSGKYDAGSYSGKYDAGSYSGKYDGGDYSGKYDGGKYSGTYDGGDYSGKYDGGAYIGGSDSGAYRGEGYYSGGGGYQGGYGTKVKTVPTAVVTDGSYVNNGFNSLNVVEHKPAVGLVGLDAVRVSGGDLHSGGYVSSYVTPSPLPAVSVTPVAPVVSSYSTVTPAPISVSTYTASTRQPSTPRPVTYYPLPSSPVTPVPSKPLISYSTVKPPVFVETYQQPSYVKTVTPAPPVYTPTVSFKTPAVPVSPVTYTYKQPLVKSEFISTGFQYSTPSPIGGVSYEQPSFVKTVTPPPATYVQPVEVKYSYPKPAVFKTPIVPLNPIQYSTPAPIEYSVSPLRPISYSTPAPLPAIKTPAVFKTPVVPLNPIQYSTPAPVQFEYSTPSPVKTVSYSSYSTPAPPVYQAPASIRPLRPISYSTPAPQVSFEYSTPAPPVVKPIVPLVSKAPVVPLNPIQYTTPAPPLVDLSYSVPAPVRPAQRLKPLIPVTYQYSTPAPQPVRPATFSTYSTPAPVVNYEYSSAPIQPVSYAKPLRPVAYATPAPAVAYQPAAPVVLKSPVVPLNPIQYIKPAPYSPAVNYLPPAPVQPLKPITYTTPAPAVSYEYLPQAPVQPLKPLKPITYTTPAPAVSYEYQPQVPVQPLKPLKPITYTTPAPAVSYEYQPQVPVQPLRPLKPITYTTPAPAVSYEYQPQVPVQPLRPLKPITYTTPAPAVSYEYQPQVSVQPLRPLRPITYTTPAPQVSYEYSAPLKPVVPAVYKTPVVPLNPIQYTTPAPVPVKPITYTTPAPAVNYEYLPPAPVQPLKPLRPLRPISYSTPAPAVSYEYSTPVVPAVYKTPVVPLNPVQYTTPAPVNFEYAARVPVRPLRPVTYTTAAPSVEYLQPVQPLKPISLSTPSPFSYDFKYQPVKPVPTVLKTPVVPLNPVQYTPAPPVVQYSTPAPLPSVSYVKPLRPVTYTTPAPPVSYEYSTPAPSPLPVTFGYKSTSYVKPVPTVLKTPVVPLNPVQYSTPAPIINQYRFGVAYQRPEIQYEPEGFVKQTAFVKTQVVQEGYDYPKPSVKFVEGPKFVTTPAPTVTYSTTPEPVTPIYKQVYNFVKAPMVSAYEKVLNAISYSSTPAPAPLPVQPVTKSPVSYAPVTVGPSYSRPALVKTPSIPVTPVAVVPEYQKVLNVVKATTTPAPLYVNHYANSYEQELLPVSTPRPVIYKQRPVLTETYSKDYTYEESDQDLYDALKSDFGTRLTAGYEQGYAYNQEKVQLPRVKLVSSTTPAPVFKETFSVRRPVKTYVQQPAVGVNYEAGSYGGSVYSTTPAPVLVSSSDATFGEQFHKETSFNGYIGQTGDSVSYEEVAQPVPVVTSTTQAPTVKITTARVSLPVVPVRPEGGYYVRRQKVRVRPVVTSENYPDVYSSTYTPSTVSTTTFAPTYSTTGAPSVTFSTTGHPDDEVDIEEEEGDAKLLQEYNGQYGGFVKQGGYSVSSTVSSIQDGEAIVGVLKKGKITYDGRRTKSKVIVVSKLSDFNPLLVGKLGAECSCDGRSNTVTVRSRQRGSGLFTPSKDSTIPDQQLVDTYLTSTSTFAPVVVGGSSSYESSYESSSYNSPVVEIRPLRKKTRVYSTTTSAPEDSDTFDAPNFLPAGADRVKADSVQCNRAGLFRHPNKCNQFYSCNWDQWKKKFTLHEFKCPIHLAYDTNLGACNWPSKGPACADDSLLV